MPLTPADLDRLETLAKGATPGGRTIVYSGPEDGFLVEAPEPLGHFQTAIGQADEHRDAALWAALDPDTVLALVEAARDTHASDILRRAAEQERDQANVRARRLIEERDRLVARIGCNEERAKRVETAARELVERLGQMNGPTFREALESGNPEAYGISNPWAIAEGRATGDERVSMREIASDLAAALRDDDTEPVS